MIFECDKNAAGPLMAGMTRNHVRNLLGKFSEFRKSAASVNTTDDFEGAGVHVFYSADNIIRGVEIFKENTVRVRGIDVFSRSFPELVAALADAGIECVGDDVGASVVGLGIGIYAPEVGDSQSPPIEAVYVEMTSH